MGEFDAGTIYSPDEFYSSDVAAPQYNPPAWMNQPGGEMPAWMQGGTPGGESGLSRLASGVSDFGGKMGAGIEKEFSDSPLSAFSKTLGLGVAGLNIGNSFKVSDQIDRSQRLAQRGQQTAQAAAQPAVDYGKTQLEQAQAGKLQPAMEASIEEWKQKAKADMRARLAGMGLGNSTDLSQIDAMVDQMALSMRSSMLTNEANTGIGALQVGANAGTGVSAAAQQQEKMLGDLIAGANQQLARLAGSQ